MSFPFIIPVLDVRSGRVVRADGGDRNTYRPLVSSLSLNDSADRVAQAIVNRHEAEVLYLADLDALLGEPRQVDVIKSVRDECNRLWVDAATSNAHDALALSRLGVDVVVGLETLPNLATWESIVKAIDSHRLVFSLDLRDGRPLAGPNWSAAPLVVAEAIVEAALSVRADGLQRMIVLDLGRIGQGKGIGTDSICSTLVRRYPEIAVFAGGGIRSRADVERLQNSGLAGVLVASALHDGEL